MCAGAGSHQTSSQLQVRRHHMGSLRWLWWEDLPCGNFHLSPHLMMLKLSYEFRWACPSPCKFSIRIGYSGFTPLLIISQLHDLGRDCKTVTFNYTILPVFIAGNFPVKNFSLVSNWQLYGIVYSKNMEKMQDFLFINF